MTSSSLAKRAVFLIVTRALLIVCAIAILLPLVVIASGAFKSESEIFTFPFKIIPDSPTLGNFGRLMENFPRYILNSIFLTTVIVVIQLVTATTGGYAFSKLRWKGRGAVFMLYVASMMIPVQAVIIPQFLIVKQLGLFNTHLSIILVSAFTAFGTFLVRQFFLTVPDSILEAARIDGANDFQIFTRVMLPLTKPVVATLVIFSFRYFWNDFFTPMIYLISPELKTLPLGMADFATEFYTYVGPQLAASLVSIVPVLAVFLLAQKYFVQGAISSGVKG